MAQNQMSREQFECAACGDDFGREAAVAECRMCHRNFCDECIDDLGFCVPCKEKTE